jgi:hypothetical protein
MHALGQFIFGKLTIFIGIELHEPRDEFLGRTSLTASSGTTSASESTGAGSAKGIGWSARGTQFIFGQFPILVFIQGLQGNDGVLNLFFGKRSILVGIECDHHRIDPPESAWPPTSSRSFTWTTTAAWSAIGSPLKATPSTFASRFSRWTPSLLLSF